MRRFRSREREGRCWLSYVGKASVEEEGESEKGREEAGVRTSVARRSLGGGAWTSCSRHSLRSCGKRFSEERQRGGLDEPFLRAEQSLRTAARQTRPPRPSSSSAR